MNAAGGDVAEDSEDDEQDAEADGQFCHDEVPLWDATSGYPSPVKVCKAFEGCGLGLDFRVMESGEGQAFC
jgi:hypothetical protein